MEKIMSEQKTEPTEAVIYGVKTGDTYHYIGKTAKNLNTEGNINKSNVTIQYANPNLRNIFLSNTNNLNVIPLVIVPLEEWYDEKLKEVVKKYQDKHPLLNAQWMLEGKRGICFWEGKTRDAHTLQRLSESKYKRVLEYDEEGRLLKIWDSGKEVGIKVFKDYKVVKGAGTTKLYDAWSATTLKGRLKFNSYWFREAEMLEYFKGIPIKLNIEAILKEEFKRRQEGGFKGNAQRQITGQRRYTIMHYDKNKVLIKKYKNSTEAAYTLRTNEKNIQKLCRKDLISDKFSLEYGEKILQPLNIKFPRYKIKVLHLINPNRKPKVIKESQRFHLKIVKERKVYQYHHTRYTVEMCDKQDQALITFDDVKDAATKLGMKESKVRLCCVGRDKYNLLNLRYGKKVTHVRPQKKHN